MKLNLTLCQLPLLAAAILVLTPQISLAAGAAPEAAAIRATAEKFHAALAAGEAKAVMALLRDDASIVEAGAVETRAQYGKGHLSEDIAYARAVPAKQLSMIVREDGNVAWVITTFRVTGTFQGKPVDNVAAETMVLAKSPAGWGIRSLHWSSHHVNKN